MASKITSPFQEVRPFGAGMTRLLYQKAEQVFKGMSVTACNQNDFQGWPLGWAVKIVILEVPMVS